MYNRYQKLTRNRVATYIAQLKFECRLQRNKQ